MEERIQLSRSVGLRDFWARQETIQDSVTAKLVAFEVVCLDVCVFVHLEPVLL